MNKAWSKFKEEDEEGLYIFFNSNSGIWLDGLGTKLSRSKRCKRGLERTKWFQSNRVWLVSPTRFHFWSGYLIFHTSGPLTFWWTQMAKSGTTCCLSFMVPLCLLGGSFGCYLHRLRFHRCLLVLGTWGGVESCFLFSVG